MMKQFLIVYSWISTYGSGFGNVECSCNYDVPRIEDLREIERQIREANNFSNVCILNIIRLEDKQEESEGEG